MRITSSSTSSSETSRAAPFGGVFVATTLIAFLLLLGLAAGLDPYDTGRLALVHRPGVQEQGPRTANASRGRDPRFDGAIIGNSHIQLVAPEALTRATGIPFVSLIVPATGPKEQLRILDYFLSHRARPPRALVFGIDGYWCTPDPEFSNWQPFPFWLYDPDDATYLRGLVRYGTLEAMLQRVLVLSGLGRRAAERPDGYSDYEESRTWRADQVERELARARASSILNESGRFPQIELLARRLARLPPGTDSVILMPPVHASALPKPGTALALSDAGCRDALVTATAGRATLLDWRTGHPASSDAALFYDGTHYRQPLARALEQDIADAVLHPRRRSDEPL